MIIVISGRIGAGKDTVGKIIQHLTSEWADEEFQDTDMLDVRSNWKIKKFAYKLKQIVSILTGISVEDLEKQEVKNRVLGEEWWYYWLYGQDKPVSYLDNKDEYDFDDLQQITVREFLQKLGTDAMRDVIHPNVWVNALFADYKKEVKTPQIRRTRMTALAAQNSIKEAIFNAKYPNWIITDMRFPNELKAVKDREGITIRVNRYCYDSAEDFLVTHPDKNIHKIGIDINMNKNSSVIDFEEPARIHGYIPLYEQHPSETALDNAEFDYVIENNSTIENLIQKVKEILIKLKII